MLTSNQAQFKMPAQPWCLLTSLRSIWARDWPWHNPRDEERGRQTICVPPEGGIQMSQRTAAHNFLHCLALSFAVLCAFWILCTFQNEWRMEHLNDGKSVSLGNQRNSSSGLFLSTPPKDATASSIARCWQWLLMRSFSFANTKDDGSFRANEVSFQVNFKITRLKLPWNVKWQLKNHWWPSYVLMMRT